MLLSLHVKNLALIEEEEVSFSDGLNILTGETGAGKSIILGSVNLALGAKADKSIIRTGKDYALIEMIFQADNDRQLERLRQMELPVEEDGTILIKRKIMPGRSVCSICGETVTLRQLREVSELLIDIYGQRENQRLLKRDQQLVTLDEFAGDHALELKSRIGAAWRGYRKLRDEWENDDLDKSARKREADLLAYEIREIEEAALKEGEDEDLEKQYRLMGSFRRINEAVQSTLYFTVNTDESAASGIERGCRELASVTGLDEELDNLTDQLSEIDTLLSDFNRALSDYAMNLTFDPMEFEQIQDRLNLINHLKDKYGATTEMIEEALRTRQERLDFLTDYEQRRQQLKQQMDREYKALGSLCQELTGIRRQAAGLLDLNYNQVDFSVRIESDPDRMGPDGQDKVVFYISMNPGEAARPLDQIASGGELSRIMLALKTVFAGRDEIYTFIFDEIDTGISGQTAWKVAEKMGRLAGDHQILCITHLPQIAAMEDSHFLIAKESSGGRTVTHISRLSETDSDGELARLLGGAAVTEAVLENAREMKRMAAASRGGE